MNNAAFTRKQFCVQSQKYSQPLIFCRRIRRNFLPIEHTWSALKRNIEGKAFVTVPLKRRLMRLYNVSRYNCIFYAAKISIVFPICSYRIHVM